MRHLIIFLLAIPAISCNNEGNTSDQVVEADSVNETMRQRENVNDSSRITADESTAKFMVQATDASLKAVEYGLLTQSKASNPELKGLGQMIELDHRAAVKQLREIASTHNVTLPDSAGSDFKKNISKLLVDEKSPGDKKLLSAIKDNHKEMLGLVESAEKKVTDPIIQEYIKNLVPKIRLHLETTDKIEKLVN